MSKQFKQMGFTLLEMILVLVIASTVLLMILGYVTQRSAELRRDRVMMQMQQILNAAMAYYVKNSTWPVPNGICPVAADQQSGGGNTPFGILQNANYIFPPLPGAPPKSPWGTDFGMSCDPITGQFWVYTNVLGANATADALTVAGGLPLGYTANGGGVTSNPPARCGATDTGCTYIIASVTIPGQNLNNARSVNFAGVYNSGECVPAPSCPLNMSPQIFVAPASVSGVWDSANPSNVYPISSFTAYATGDATGAPMGSGSVSPCSGGTLKTCPQLPGTDPGTTKYWRVCLAVVTESGAVAPTTGSQQGVNMGSVVAITRCVPNNGTEIPSGSTFGYFQQ